MRILRRDVASDRGAHVSEVAQLNNRVEIIELKEWALACSFFVGSFFCLRDA